MATYTRKNAWNNGGALGNPDLFWYARGVGKMQERKLDDPTGWWFFAAIHGEYVTPASLKQKGAFPWKDIPAPPYVPTTPLPETNVSDKYWNQCQHQSWYFTPWHRGYLIALEAQIRAEIKVLGGPFKTWALPYWDYFGPNDEYNIPPAFTEKKLPDSSPNPLYVAARYGPNSDGNIYIPTPAWIKQHPNDPPPAVTEDCMSDDLYTGSDAKTKPPGFGGPETKFSHSGGRRQPFGNLENQPHNVVHVYVGENSPDGSVPGLMSVPALAALDPIFYLHHANIDRMWASWNQTNANPTDPKWLKGPAAAGERPFIMPGLGVYTPQQMNSLNGLDYVYDSLQKPAPVVNVLSQRLMRLGATAAAKKVNEGATVTIGSNEELVGASQEGLPITGSGVSTSVKLDPNVRAKVSASLAMASETAPPDRVFLELENVRGTQDGTVLSVYVDLPEGAKPAEHPELLAGSIGLFGLRAASEEDSDHGGQGLDFVLDITKIIDALHLKNALNVDSLNIRIVPHRPISDRAQITIGRISIYRQGQ